MRYEIKSNSPEEAKLILTRLFKFGFYWFNTKNQLYSYLDSNYFYIPAKGRKVISKNNTTSILTEKYGRENYKQICFLDLYSSTLIKILNREENEKIY